MAITTFGKVFLDGLQFDTDPQIYEPTNWPKRHIIIPGIDGSVTIQDFGHFAKDNTVRLSSGPTGFLNQATVAALHVKFRTKAAVFSLTDWMGNEFTVFIVSFRPIATFIGLSDADNLFTYDMELRVVAIAKLFGTTFTGP